MRTQRMVSLAEVRAKDRQFEALLRRAARFQKSGQPLPPVDGGRKKGEV
jgi:hypothetical protein